MVEYRLKNNYFPHKNDLVGDDNKCCYHENCHRHQQNHILAENTYFLNDIQPLKN